jgi:hypothetical protein
VQLEVQLELSWRGGVCEKSLIFGGEGEIRTHEALANPPVFKTGAINRSATSPSQSIQWLGFILSGCGNLIGIRCFDFDFAAP